MKSKKKYIIMLFILLVFVFFPIKVQAKDLEYEAHINKDGYNQSYLTFRKYVRHYGQNDDSGWNPTNKWLSEQSTSQKGSYVTIAMVFHKNYGTNYDWWDETNTVVELGYDHTNGTRIDTETYEDQNGNELNFFNQYNITVANTFIRLRQNSNIDGSMGQYLTSDLKVSKERIWKNIAITDFTATGDVYTNIMDAIKNNATKEGNYYKTMVSGQLQVKAFETGRVWGLDDNIKTAQQLIDIMIPEGNAYSGSKLNSYWSGNDFGFEAENAYKDGLFKLGNSVLNNFDNYLYVYDNGEASKEVYVNHFDNRGNQLWWQENPTQELLDENGNKITNLANTTLSKTNGGGNWQEAYGFKDTQKLRVSASSNILSGNLKNEYGYPYKFKEFIKRGYNDWGDKVASQYKWSNDDYQYTVDSSDAKITTIDYYYEAEIPYEKYRKIYVNHLSTDGTRLTELANTSQTLLPSYTSVSNMSGSSESRGYMEYYNINAENYMLLKPSSKLDSSKRVKIGDKWYEYDHFNTCSGSTYEQALGNNRLTDQTASKYTITHNNTETIVTFYYKPIDGDDDDSGSGEYNVNILGKLAFTSKFNNTANNSEFIPVTEKLYPYIEGAQKYILPNINENTGKVVDSTKRSYYDDYEEYRQVTIEPYSKGGISNKNDGSFEYKQSGTTTLKVYNGSTKNTIKIAGNDWVLADYANTEGIEDVQYLTGTEAGNVLFHQDYTKSGSGYSYECYYELDGKKVVTSSGQVNNRDQVPPSRTSIVNMDVPVTYKVTFKKKWKLSHLYIYRIKDNSTIVNVQNGSTNGDVRGGVYQNGDSNISVSLSNDYYDSLKDKLKKYYEDYYDTRKEIPTAVMADFKTYENDFKQEEVDKYTVGKNKYNGIRKATATIQYEYYDLVTGTTTSAESLSHEYDDLDRTNGNERINIYTPLYIAQPEIKSESEVINHTGDESYNYAIQRGVEFTFTPKVGNYTYGDLTVDTTTYLEEYYVQFDFDLSGVTGTSEVKMLDNSGNRVGISSDIGKGTYIIIPKGGYIKATANGTDIGLTKNKVRIFASTINQISENFVENRVYATGNSLGSIDTSDSSDSCIDNSQIVQRGTSTIVNENTTYNKYFGYTSNMHLDARYIVYQDVDTKNVGRIYDFRITDCTDLGYKNVFRKNDNTDQKINETNDINYFYSGKFECYEGTNSIIPRTTSNILPLGPYKNNEDTTYIYAPKLGYRISFDVKTTGYINEEDKKIKITPSYYYISKDGSTYEDNITLYYKTTSGKYRKFEGSGYTIQFKPNDGYRAIEYDSEQSTLSKKYVNLNISQAFNLTKNSMMTSSTDGYIQCWYGEFKLPNSTIAVNNDDTNSTVNNPLKDGYIGVKFKIEAIESSGRTLAYDNSDKGSGNGATNTTQWDYEGYLGYSKGGADVASGDVESLQLEKGTWNISSQNMYQNVKGTVILYDIDNRAANDFE